MKKLFTILLVTVLTSCVTALEPPKSNTDYKNIIGKPIKIGNIQVVQYDFLDQMNWNDADKACETLGDGWRLPNKHELNILYENKDKIGGFANDVYWSSSERDDNFAWLQYFLNGNQNIYDKRSAHYVRAVRAF